MKPRLRALGLLLFLAFGAAVSAQEALPGRIVVKLSASGGVTTFAGVTRFRSATLNAIADRFHASSIRPLFAAAGALRKAAAAALDGFVVITCPAATVINDALDALRLDPAVEYAEPDYLYRVDFTPNDSAWAAQWGMQRIGMERAWDITRGSSTIKIGVIDTGIDYLHPDLAGSLWINAAEDINHNGRLDPWPSTEVRNGVSGDFDGIDNDGNGFVDDVIGYDFVNETGLDNTPGGDYRDPDPDPLDEMGHGTSVSGIIGAATNNTIGVAGIADGCRMMTLRAFDARGVGAESDVASALAYAVANGASVVNMSFGDVVYSRLLRDVIRWANTLGVTMVASAGNASSDELHFPSAFDETISVSATVPGDGLAGFSSWGQTVTIAAPGQDIITTNRGGGYTSFNGTSASAPFVTGVAALVKSLHPDFTPEEVRGILISTADDIGAQGWDQRFGAGLVNARRALLLPHPTEVRILTPSTNLATSARELVVTGTAASPLMTGFTVSYGVGLDPARWTPLTDFIARQAIAETLVVWDISALRDSVYTLRLSAVSNTGATLEHRVVLRIDHTPPVFTGIGFIPSIDGRFFGVAAGFTTDDPALGKVWYRVKGSADPFQWVSAEGGTTNNLFVATAHTAFLGKTEFVPGLTYELYFTAENEAGLVSTAKDGGRNFEIAIPQPAPETGFDRKAASLPPGRLYRTATDFDNNGIPEIVYNDFTTANRTRATEWVGGAPVDIAHNGVSDRIVRGVGDVDGDGVNEVLCSYVRHGYLYKASAAGQFPDKLVWADTTSPMFWPITIADVNKDGRNEILAVINDSTVGVYTYANAALTRIATIVNPTSAPAHEHNTFTSPRVAIGDFNNNGLPDLLFGDGDADFFIVENTGGGAFRLLWKSENDFVDASDYVVAADFDGDGRDEFAIGFHTGPDDIIPFWFFGIGRLNATNQSTMLWSQEFYGVEQSGQVGYFSNVQNSISAVQADRDPAMELAIATFPELYLIKWDPAARVFAPVWSRSFANTNAVVGADLDANGINDLVFAQADSIVVYEARLPYTGPAPVRAIIARYQTPQSIHVEWTVAAPAPLYRVYKGADAGTLQFLGEIATTSFTDFIAPTGPPFLYAITAVDSARTPVESPALYSRVFAPHAPPSVDTVVYLGGGQVRVATSQAMGGEVPPTSAFLLDATVPPVSVALLDARSVLLTFPAVANGHHAVTLPALRDGEGIPFDPAALWTFEAAVTEPQRFFIERVEFIPAFRIDVHFNRPVSTTAGDIRRFFAFEPTGTVSSAIVDTLDARIVHCEITSSAPIGALGVEYIITVSDLKSADGVTIVGGAGGTAGVVINRPDLSAVYVFPNPLRETDMQEFVTFANLTQRAVVRIYTASGVFVREVVASLGTGGVRWDLKGDGGSTVSDGVYFYYITGTDASGRDVPPVKGKFAIAR